MNALNLELTRRSLASWFGGQYENISSQISNGMCEEMGFVFLVDLRGLPPGLDRVDFRGLGSVSPGMVLFLVVVIAVAVAVIAVAVVVMAVAVIVARTLRRFAGGPTVQMGWRSPSSSRSANPSSTV